MAASFCLLDLFAIGFLATWRRGGLGERGLLLATSAWSALVAVQVMGFGQKRRAGEVAPVQAELRAQQPPSFQECQDA
ncbi:unnamed protein product [Durusdinium trenchii]|uniref:Uncharacterized protein n=1 Tax=Durusdinium trenchii TaxID=1381693 RepID=A0ABP0LZY8_9DINO